MRIDAPVIIGGFTSRLGDASVDVVDFAISAGGDLTITPDGGFVKIGGKLGILEGGTSPTKYTYFQGGDQSVDLTYTLPTAYPASAAFLKISNAGVMTTDTTIYLNSTTGLTLDQTSPQSFTAGTLTGTGLLNVTAGVLGIEAGKNNYTAITSPTINDDSSAGYAVGSLWIVTATKKTFRCFSASVGAADWEEIGFFLPQPTVDHSYNGLIAQFTAGENLVMGDLLFYKSDGKVWKANASSTSTMSCFSMALETKSAETVVMALLRGYLKDDSLYNFTTGGQSSSATGLIYVSEATSGLATQARPLNPTNIVQIVGFAHSPDIFYFNPDNTFIELL